MQELDAAAVGDAVRHAANNLAMVILSNLDLLARAVPEDTPASRQLARSRLAAERLLAVLGPYTRLEREPGLDLQQPEAVLRALLPLLQVVAGQSLPITLEAAAVQPVKLPRPALDLALVRWALTLATEAPRDAARHIALEAGATSGAVIRLTPSPAGAVAALVAAAQAGGGSTRVSAEEAELWFPGG